MSTDMSRHAQMTGSHARNGGARMPETTLSAEAARLDKLDNDHFEKKALDLAQPTLTRPALIIVAEVDAIRTGYSTGSGRLDVLSKVTNKRLDFYTEANGGGAPFDPISDADRNKCAKFFTAYGMRLADQPRVAPPNPLRSKADADKLLEQSKVDLHAPAASHAAADQAIVESETKGRPQAPGAAPETKPAPTAVPLSLPPAATLDIEFLSEQGYPCRLHLQAPSWSGVLDQLGQATGRLATMKAKAPPAAVVAPGVGQGVGAAGADQPKVCAIHKTPMKENRFKWFCPEKDENQENGYCAYEIPKKGSRK